MALYSSGSKLYKNLWERVIDEAEAFNDPGHFTAFIGFEWTSLNITIRSLCNPAVITIIGRE
jgi:hypothetical protein